MTSKPALQRTLKGTVHIEGEDKHIQEDTGYKQYQASMSGDED